MSKTLLAAIFALGACTYSMPENIDPLDGTTLIITAGDDQSATVGSTLAAPIIIQATDVDGNPLPELTLSLELAGGGSVPDPAIRTDVQGFAHTVLTLGTVPGENRVSARVLGLELEPAVATAVGLVGAPVTLSIASGDNQEAVAGEALTAPLVVRAADMFDNPVPEASIELTVLDGGGTLSESSVATGADGTASATLTLGTTMGANVIEARLGLLPEVTFAANGIAGAATTIVKTFGDAQSAPAGTTLTQQLTVRVEDQYGNPVANADVEFVPLTGGGSVNPTHALTDAAGSAKTTYRLSASTGLNTIEARLAALPVARFTAAGLTGAIAQLIVKSGTNQTGVVGTTFTTPIVIEARDSANNVVQGAIIQFQNVGGGNGAAPNATTSSTGLASSSYRLNTIAGQNTVRAYVGSVTTPNFAMTGTPAAANRVAFTVGPPPGIQEIEAMFPVSARVTDQYGNQVSPQPQISWVATGHQLSASSGQMTNVTVSQMTDFTVEARSGALTPATAAVNVRGFKPRVDIMKTSVGTITKFFVVDMNNDTKPDVVAYNTSGVYVLINTSAGTPRFTDPVHYAANLNIREVSIGELTNDTRPDLVLTHDGVYTISNCSSGCVSVLRNSTSTGSQTPQLTHSFIDNTSSPGTARLLDVNLDDRGDIVLARSYYQFDVLLGTSTGGFDAPQMVNRSGYQPLTEVADLTADGRPDLICGSELYINTTSVGSTTPSFTTSNSYTFTGLVDFDGDGKVDGVSTTYYSFSLLRNTTSPGAAMPTFTSSSSFNAGGQQFAAGDFNGDSKPDFVFSNGNLTVFRNKVTPTTFGVSPATTLSTSSSSYPNYRDMGTGDIDGDGRSDIIVLMGGYSTSFLVEVFLAE